MLTLLLACAADEPGTESPEPATDTVEQATGDTASPTTPTPTGETGTGPLVPLLSEGALDARCPDVDPPAPHRSGTELHRVVLTGGALCNDGTLPVLYVRAATDPAHANDWVIDLEGGSRCVDHEDCAIRWCGEDFYDATKMSTAWTLEAIAGDGIRSTAAWNAFAGFNQVQFYYCSSDLWVGTKRDHVFDGEPPYRLHFEGHDIIVQGLDRLEAATTSDDGAVTLPPLGDAETVLFTGSSAGGYGVAQHVDHLAGRLPGARVVGYVDSFLGMPPEVMTPDEVAAFDAASVDRWDVTATAAWGMAPDDSCAAAETAEPWRCLDLDRVMRRHVDAELAVHQDLFDSVLLGFYEDMAGMALPRGAEAYQAALELYAATEPGMSLHGSRCFHHQSLVARDWFVGMSVQDAGGAPWSVHDQLLAIVAGGAPVAIDTVAGAGSTCPP